MSPEPHIPLTPEQAAVINARLVEEMCERTGMSAELVTEALKKDGLYAVASLPSSGIPPVPPATDPAKTIKQPKVNGKLLKEYGLKAEHGGGRRSFASINAGKLSEAQANTLLTHLAEEHPHLKFDLTAENLISIEGKATIATDEITASIKNAFTKHPTIFNGVVAEGESLAGIAATKILAAETAAAAEAARKLALEAEAALGKSAPAISSSMESAATKTAHSATHISGGKIAAIVGIIAAGGLGLWAFTRQTRKAAGQDVIGFKADADVNVGAAKVPTPGAEKNWRAEVGGSTPSTTPGVAP